MSSADKSSSKQAKLAQWLARAKEKKKQDAILPLESGKAAPLSYGQQRLWLLQHLYPKNPFYHYAELLRLYGPLNVAQLKSAFHRVLERHPVFSYGFFTEGGQMVQRVLSKEHPDLDILDLTHLPESDQENKLKELAIHKAREPFDLQSGKLARLFLIRKNEQEHVLLLVMHHIITDNASFDIFLKEIGVLYRGIPSEIDALPSVRLQYADFANWQRQRNIPQGQVKYWKKKLSGELPFMDMPTDFPRPAIRSFGGEYLQLAIPNDLYQQVKILALEQNVTTFALLLAVYNILLYRYAHQQDILIGVPISNRDQVELESMMGFFNETQVLRSQISPQQSFRDFLHAVKTTVLEAFDHKQLPFELLVKELNPQRELGHNPLFQVMFLYKEAPKAGKLDEDVSYKHETLDIGVAKFDLTLCMMEEEDGLTAIMEYATDLFRPSYIQRMLQNFVCLLEDAVQHPEKAVGELNFLSAADRQALFQDWNSPVHPLEEQKGIHDWIEEQAGKHPNTIALRWQGGQMSYGDLMIQAQSVANHLIRTVDPSTTLIGMCGEAGPEMIIGMLGILKAGKAYVPIDPSYPVNRIQLMLEDAGIYLMLTGRGCDQLAFEGVDIREVQALVAEHEASPVQPEIRHPHAYVIYTSGSSGRPKGVPVSHRNLLHSTQARTVYYPDSPSAFLLLSSFSFDSSVAGMYWTLCTGGTLVLARKHIEQDLGELSDWIQECQVSHTLLLPSLYDMLIQHIDFEDFRSLRTVIVAGEGCAPDVITRHFERVPSVNLYNEYGPTEATVWASVHQFRPEDAAGRVPIGRAIARTQLFVLDEHLQAVPVGAVGELYISGEGVVDGYLHQPQLTQERFVKNPFDPSTSYMLYRTGDLARFRPDGVLEFWGRKDEQVKLRGYRIELGEIELALKKQAGVRDAVVLFEQSTEQDGQLGTNPSRLTQALLEVGEGLREELLTSVESLTDKEAQLLLESLQAT